MMLGEESESATYWKACGDEALAHGVEHVVMMVSHLSNEDDHAINNQIREHTGQLSGTKSKWPQIPTQGNHL